MYEKNKGQLLTFILNIGYKVLKIIKNHLRSMVKRIENM